VTDSVGVGRPGVRPFHSSRARQELRVVHEPTRAVARRLRATTRRAPPRASPAWRDKHTESTPRCDRHDCVVFRNLREGLIVPRRALGRHERSHRVTQPPKLAQLERPAVPPHFGDVGGRDGGLQHSEALPQVDARLRGRRRVDSGGLHDRLGVP